MSVTSANSKNPIPSDVSGKPRVNVLGVGLSVLNLRTALENIAAALKSKTKGYICVSGVHGVMEAQADERFKNILNGSFLNTPDGMPMVWAGKLNGHREMDRVYGPDLMLLVCEYTRDNGYSHFFYGGGPGVAEELKQNIERKFPGIKIVGTYTPPFRPLNEEEEAALVAETRAKKPDIIWVGLSTPKQEKFMAQYLDKLDTTLMFGVGAAFDFHAGRVRQAPRWMQRSGMEWFFRLCCEPKRLWKRYLKNNPRFAFRFLSQKLGLKNIRWIDQRAVCSVTLISRRVLLVRQRNNQTTTAEGIAPAQNQQSMNNPIQASYSTRSEPIQTGIR